MRVFLGGTQNNSLWRDQVTINRTIDYIIPEPKVNGVTSSITEEAKEKCDILVYTITPLSIGVSDIVEAATSIWLYPNKEIIICVLEIDGYMHFNTKMLMDIRSSFISLIKYGLTVVNTIDDLNAHLNKLRFNGTF